MTEDISSNKGSSVHDCSNSFETSADNVLIRNDINGDIAGQSVFVGTCDSASDKKSFHITSVTLQRNSTDGNADESADESRSEEPAMSADVRAQTPRHAEHVVHKEDVLYKVTSVGSAPIIPTSTQYGIAVVSNPNADHIDNVIKFAANDKNTDFVIRNDCLQNGFEKSGAITANLSAREFNAKNERFKVVKIESNEPFKRGRWVCMDFLDQSMDQIKKTSVISNDAKESAPKAEPNGVMTTNDKCLKGVNESDKTAPVDSANQMNGDITTSVSPNQTYNAPFVPTQSQAQSLTHIVIPQPAPPQGASGSYGHSQSLPQTDLQHIHQPSVPQQQPVHSLQQSFHPPHSNIQHPTALIGSGVPNLSNIPHHQPDVYTQSAQQMTINQQPAVIQQQYQAMPQQTSQPRMSAPTSQSQQGHCMPQIPVSQNNQPANPPAEIAQQAPLTQSQSNQPNMNQQYQQPQPSGQPMQHSIPQIPIQQQTFQQPAAPQIMHQNVAQQLPVQHQHNQAPMQSMPVSQQMSNVHQTSSQPANIASQTVMSNISSHMPSQPAQPVQSSVTFMPQQQNTLQQNVIQPASQSAQQGLPQAGLMQSQIAPNSEQIHMQAMHQQQPQILQQQSIPAQISQPQQQVQQPAPSMPTHQQQMQHIQQPSNAPQQSQQPAPQHAQQPQQTAQQLPQQTAQQLPQQTAQQMPQQTAQQMPQQTAQQLPQQMQSQQIQPQQMQTQQMQAQQMQQPVQQMQLQQQQQIQQQQQTQNGQQQMHHQQVIQQPVVQQQQQQPVVQQQQQQPVVQQQQQQPVVQQQQQQPVVQQQPQPQQQAHQLMQGAQSNLQHQSVQQPQSFQSGVQQTMAQSNQPPSHSQSNQPAMLPNVQPGLMTQMQQPQQIANQSLPQQHQQIQPKAGALQQPAQSLQHTLAQSGPAPQTLQQSSVQQQAYQPVAHQTAPMSEQSAISVPTSQAYQVDVLLPSMSQADMLLASNQNQQFALAQQSQNMQAQMPLHVSIQQPYQTAPPPHYVNASGLNPSIAQQQTPPLSQQPYYSHAAVSQPMAQKAPGSSAITSQDLQHLCAHPHQIASSAAQTLMAAPAMQTVGAGQAVNLALQGQQPAQYSMQSQCVYAHSGAVVSSAQVSANAQTQTAGLVSMGVAMQQPAQLQYGLPSSMGQAPVSSTGFGANVAHPAQLQQPLYNVPSSQMYGGQTAPAQFSEMVEAQQFAYPSPQFTEQVCDVVRGTDEMANQQRPAEDVDSTAGNNNAVAIDNKIEQAMDLVKSHLMFAVREEVEVLKEKIAELMDRIGQLEMENSILKANASPETMELLPKHASSTAGSAASVPSSQSQPPTAPTNGQPP